LGAVIKSSENFPGNFEVNQRVMHLQVKAKKAYFEKLENSEAVGSITETFSLSIATNWRVASVVLKICCERCWQVLEDIEIFFFQKK